MTPSPPLADSLQVVQISSLAAALVKLNIGIPVEDVIKAVHREDEAKRATLSAQATQRRAALSKLALHPTEQSTGLHMTTVSIFIPKPTTPTNVDPLAKERRRRLVQLTKDSYPDGKVPDPFTLSWLALSQDVAANKLPFILASRIVVTSATDMSDNPPENLFEDVWCLWDSGVQTSFVLTSQLHSAVRDNQDQGSALMDITFSNVAQTISSVIHFRPQLPNGVTFIILGQHALLNRIQYQIQPVLINPQLTTQHSQAYGQIDLVSWSDPVNDQLNYDVDTDTAGKNIASSSYVSVFSSLLHWMQRLQKFRALTHTADTICSPQPEAPSRVVYLVKRKIGTNVLLEPVKEGKIGKRQASRGRRLKHPGLISPLIPSPTDSDGHDSGFAESPFSIALRHQPRQQEEGARAGLQKSHRLQQCQHFHRPGRLPLRGLGFSKSRSDGRVPPQSTAPGHTTRDKVGTYGFMAPEVDGSVAYSYGTDHWSMVTPIDPVDDPGLREIHPFNTVACTYALPSRRMPWTKIETGLPAEPLQLCLATGPPQPHCCGFSTRDRPTVAKMKGHPFFATVSRLAGDGHAEPQAGHPLRPPLGRLPAHLRRGRRTPQRGLPAHPACPAWGGSTGPEDPDAYKVTDNADDLVALVEHLRADAVLSEAGFFQRGLVLVGHSMGAKIAQVLATRGDFDGLLKGLVLVCSAPLGPMELSAEMRSQQLTAFSTRGSAEMALKHFVLGSDVGRDEVRRLVDDCVGELREVGRKRIKPVAVVVGGLDKIEAASKVDEIVVRVLKNAGASVTMTVLEGVGHLIPVEAPEQLAVIIRKFIQ
ncbi:hypothetical protein DFH07DRAFT_956058 [Mycena maculata]|uniref:AB hydrolase-1 domain-containing protein n=1 Tax=Mycena maculata TaxID=230809 RepID=A0AAD7JKA6_9AGAR|nr:hypothetical protein DFH07DRAFT_956058 [Mycena maculata]